MNTLDPETGRTISLDPRTLFIETSGAGTAIG
jgi:hypothetical protein